MSLPSVNEVSGYLAGVFRMVRGDASGLQDLDLTTSGFWRSFWALIYELPGFCVIWAVQRGLRLRRDPSLDLGLGDLATSLLSEFLETAVVLVVVALLARPLGIADRFAQWVISANWLSLLVTYVLAAVYLAASVLQGSEPIMLVAFIVALIAAFRVYRCALGGDVLLAFAVLLISVFVAMSVAFVTGA